MATKKGPWSFKVMKRKHNGTSIVLMFKCIDGGARREMFSEWYPPWQNDIMRENAKCMVDDLNKAFAERNASRGPKGVGK